MYDFKENGVFITTERAWWLKKLITLKCFYLRHFQTDFDLLFIILFVNDCRPFIKLPAVVVRGIVFLIKWMDLNLSSRDLKHVSVHNTIQLMSRTRTYNCSAAERHLQYSPIVPLDVSSTRSTNPIFFIIL